MMKRISLPGYTDVFPDSTFSNQVYVRKEPEIMDTGKSRTEIDIILTLSRYHDPDATQLPVYLRARATKLLGHDYSTAFGPVSAEDQGPLAEPAYPIETQLQGDAIDHAFLFLPYGLVRDLAFDDDLMSEFLTHSQEEGTFIIDDQGHHWLYATQGSIPRNVIDLHKRNGNTENPGWYFNALRNPTMIANGFGERLDIALRLHEDALPKKSKVYPLARAKTKNSTIFGTNSITCSAEDLIKVLDVLYKGLGNKELIEYIRNASVERLQTLSMAFLGNLSEYYIRTRANGETRETSFMLFDADLHGN